MGTKNDPGTYDCWAAALPDEPVFILLARDPNFAHHVNDWARRRLEAIVCGDRPNDDYAKVTEAQQTAVAGAWWRRDNNGIWRKKVG